MQSTAINPNYYPIRLIVSCETKAVLFRIEGQPKNGREEGIRTLDALLTHTPLAGERLRPLGHLSIILA